MRHLFETVLDNELYYVIALTVVAITAFALGVLVGVIVLL